MRYTVVWHAKAQDQLAELWLTTSDRQQISTTADSIDARLSVDPLAQGSLVIPGYRELIVPPLRVVFSVEEADRMVMVVLVTES